MCIYIYTYTCAVCVCVKVHTAPCIHITYLSVYTCLCIHVPMDPCKYVSIYLSIYLPPPPPEGTTLHTRGLRGPVAELCKRQHRRAGNEPSSCRRHLFPVRLEGTVPIMTDGCRASGLDVAAAEGPLFRLHVVMCV